MSKTHLKNSKFPIDNLEEAILLCSHWIIKSPTLLKDIVFNYIPFFLLIIIKFYLIFYKKKLLFLI